MKKWAWGGRDGYEGGVGGREGGSERATEGRRMEVGREEERGERASGGWIFGVGVSSWGYAEAVLYGQYRTVPYWIVQGVPTVHSKCDW